MKRIYVIMATAIALLAFSSCLRNILCIRGNGIAATEVRRLGAFTRIENSTSIDIVYRKADTTGVTINADENLIEYITTVTNNNTLEIRTRDITTCLDFDTKPLITVTSPGLQKIFASGSGTFIADEMSGIGVDIKMSGSGDISVAKVSATDLTVTLSGSGNINIGNCNSINSDVYLSGSGSIGLTGQCESSEFKISGSGEINAENWMLGTGDIIISGSGNIFTSVKHTLTALISGSGNIYLKGDPIIKKTISGSGRIIKYK